MKIKKKYIITIISIIFSILLFILDQCFFKFLNFKQGIGVSIIIMFIAGFINFGIKSYQFFNSKLWPFTEGVVKSSKMKPIGDSYYAEIIYKYTVNNIEYESDNIRVFFNKTPNSEKAELDTIKYPYNKRITVFYDPKDTSISYLEKDVMTNLPFGLISHFLILVFGILLIIGVL